MARAQGKAGIGSTWTKRTAWAIGATWLACSGLVAAAISGCGDDDTAVSPGGDAGDGSTPNNVDSGGSSSGGDSGSGTDSGTDAGAKAPAIVPQTTARTLNSINPYGLVFASDGFLYNSGATMDGAERKLAVWRYKDGAIDTTFGTAGVMTVGIDGDESSFDIVEVSAGNFIVQAVSAGKVYLVKLTKDSDGGTGVFSFGTPTAVAFADWIDNDPAWPGATPPAYQSWGIAVDRSTAATPKIVVFAFGAPAKGANTADAGADAGGSDGGVQRTDNDRWVARVMADTLAPDPSFNSGKAYTADGDGKELADNARRGIVLADGSIVSSGYTNYGTGLGNHVVLIRLAANGTPDATFGFGSTIPGQTKINPFLTSSGNAEAYGVVRQSTGRYVTGGYGSSNFEVPTKAVDMITLGVKPGTLDATYGKLGAFAWQSENDKAAGLGATPYTDRARDITILPDDRLLFLGVYDDYASIYVLDANGKPDPSSGVGGLLEYSYPMAFFHGVVSPDGKTVAAATQSTTRTIDGGAVSESLIVTLKVGQ